MPPRSDTEDAVGEMSMNPALRARRGRQALAGVVTVLALILTQLIWAGPTRWVDESLVGLGKDLSNGKGAWAYFEVIAVNILPVILFYFLTLFTLKGVGAFLSGAVAQGLMQARGQDH
jgi:hypothetical protein